MRLPIDHHRRCQNYFPENCKDYQVRANLGIPILRQVFPALTNKLRHSLELVLSKRNGSALTTPYYGGDFACNGFRKKRWRVKISKIFPLVAGVLLSVSASGAQANYCAAIRGNGELMPAHWGAMSSLVEEKGLPSAMAGGSSASITMFLLESLSLNPHLRDNSEKALMIKSFQGYAEALSQTAEGKAIQSLLTDKRAFQALIATAPKLQNTALLAKHLDSLKTLMASKDIKELINPDFVLYVERTSLLAQQNNPELFPILRYRSGQIQQALENFGKFDAKTDKTLFFRPGLISFTKVAQVFGDMADFYAGYNNESPAGKQIEQRLREFLNVCTPGTKNLSWRELNNQRPQCRQLLGSAVLMYRANTAPADNRKSRVQELIGTHIPAYATTSVITGQAVEDFAQAFVEYQKNSDDNFADQFTMSQEDLRFGYWGENSALEKIEDTLARATEFKKDAKSQKFLSLGAVPWLEILSTSPAEPGLSRIVALNRQQLSAGGWSDLHPTLVLKAHGCEEIIYITRKGEESEFAQGIFRRLTKADQATWSRFYDMNNPESSIMRSQRAADKIKCTNWNQFNVLKDMNGLIEEAMSAPLINPPHCR